VNCRIVWSELKPEVVFNVQKMAQYASFCLIVGPFKGEVPVFARLSPVRVRVSFTTWAVRSAIQKQLGFFFGLTCLDVGKFFAFSRVSVTADMLTKYTEQAAV